MAAELGIEPLAWNAQAITVSYERARGLRVVGQRADGFTITASQTVAVPVEQLYDAFVEPRPARAGCPTTSCASARRRGQARPFRLGRRRLARPRHVPGQDEGQSTLAVEHARLADAAEADRMKPFWRERLAASRVLEG